MARVTLQTIADEVGVSRMTVSNAFSQPDQLSSALRTKILEAADRLGYGGPDPTARALARGRSGAIGVLLTDSPEDAFTDDVATGFLAAVAGALRPSALSLTLLHSHGTDDLVPARDIPMDGAIVYSCNPNDEAIGYLTKRGIPMVLVDEAPRPKVAAVNIDDRGGARAVARHLVELGHRRLGVVVPKLDLPQPTENDIAPLVPPGTVHERLLGWGEAIAAAGATTLTVGLPESHPHESAQAAGIALLTAENPPSAVLAFSDAIAVEVIDAAHRLGLRVPDDVSVAGFDDNPVAARLAPPLTTVRQDLRTKGQAAVTTLLAAIERARAGSPARAARIVIPTELVVRASTGPPPKR